MNPNSLIAKVINLLSRYCLRIIPRRVEFTYDKEGDKSN
jgi:hypothetical protein